MPGRLRTALALTGLLVLVATTARADQLACNHEKDAKRAVVRLAPGTVMIDYCSLCTSGVVVVRVEKAEVVKGCMYEVAVQGQELAESVKHFDEGKGVAGAKYRVKQAAYDAHVDLAYAYVEVAPNDFRWLGGQLHLKAEVKVPRLHLPGDTYQKLGPHRIVNALGQSR